MKQFVTAIKYYANLHDYDMETLAKMIGLSRGGLYKKLKNPDLFRLDELVLLCKIFNCDLTVNKNEVIVKL